MINQNSLDAVSKSCFSTQFCKPLYDSYCFSRIPATIESLFGKPHAFRLPQDTTGDIDQEYDIVILFLIDGFGWTFFQKYQDRYPFLKRFVERGIVSKITSQFPSTTANHVTCINTGLNVGQSGVYEWFYYEPQLDRVIAPLLFSFAGDKEVGTLKKTNISPKDLYPTRTIYEDLEKMGVTSYAIQLETIAHSPYSSRMFHGAKQIGYSDFSDALNQVITICKSPDPSSKYIYLYFGDIDGMGHRQGIDSEEFNKAVDKCFTACEEILWKEISKLNKKIAFMVTADHGMTSVEPKTTFYLNERVPEILSMIKKNKAGELIVPAGSCRDFFLHIKEECVDKALLLLKERLFSIAEVYKTEELIALNFFGPGSPSAAFLGRVGNLVIIPYENEAVWWHEKHRFDQHFYGTHGGLSREEMETIFLFQSLEL